MSSSDIGNNGDYNNTDVSINNIQMPYNNADVTILKSKKLFVLDMDGTFYLGNRIIEGSLEFIERLRETGRKILFFTNNSSRIPEFYKTKLLGMGCQVSHEEIVTSGDVTIEYLKKHYPTEKIFLVGTALLEDSFKNTGINLLCHGETGSDAADRSDMDDRPAAVVVGFDTTLTYEKIKKACRYISEGADFIATHPDINCPVEDGFIPDCGAMCAMITVSTGIKPKFLGKPFKETLDFIVRYTGCRPDDMVVAGDRLYTDIALGVNNDVTSILVLSGETTREDLETSNIKPDFVFSSLAAILEILSFVE